MQQVRSQHITKIIAGTGSDPRNVAGKSSLNSDCNSLLLIPGVGCGEVVPRLEVVRLEVDTALEGSGRLVVVLRGETSTAVREPAGYVQWVQSESPLEAIYRLLVLQHNGPVIFSYQGHTKYHTSLYWASIVHMYVFYAWHYTFTTIIYLHQKSSSVVAQTQLRSGDGG